METFIAKIKQTYRDDRRKQDGLASRFINRTYPADSMLIATLAAKNELASNERIVSVRRQGDTFRLGRVA